MSTQLDILALEPFYGGARRAMLETVIRCSRHRWTLLRLPPRRIERRLTTAANWFAEQLNRHWVGKVDVLFTSEAMNLANLYRLVPAVAEAPSVVYFHDNQLPAPGATQHAAHDLVNLSTAASATEIWFNSRFHHTSFLKRAAATFAEFPDLGTLNPLADLRGKSRYLPPPTDLRIVEQIGVAEQVLQRLGLIFVETRDADVELLNLALNSVQKAGGEFSLITVGPVNKLSEIWKRRTISEADELGQIRSLCEAQIFLSIRPQSTFDLHCVRGLLAGCVPVIPDSGVYMELLPEKLHNFYMYPAQPEDLADRLLQMLTTAAEPKDGIAEALKPLDALTACRTFDERLQHLAEQKQST
ncbi:MAG TPA: DUF3524 domain-containing protein [Tepidisphaeraceae bacterium]|jgi:hypothetical protein|nr:DUF3524 domain-containing protein [Tepidisphaeraceae bacterium]